MIGAVADQAVAVTGIGVLTPLADQPDELARALCAGRSRVADPEPPGTLTGSRLSDFDARRYANIRGMRVYPRTTQLQICAALLALRQAGLEPTQLDPTQLGTVTASSYAHMETLLEYDRGLVELGMQRTNPTLFPLALPSAPGALTALALGAKAFAITVNDGGAAGLSALGQGARLLAQQRAQVCVVTGAWSECRELALSAARAGLLTDQVGFAVFDRRSRGTVFGELAIAVVLEPLARAQARGHAPLGYVRGQASAFASDAALAARMLARAARSALESARCQPSELSLISAGASGVPAADEAEAHALDQLLGDARERVPVTAAKSLLGESLDASSLVQAAVALQALQAGVAPPIGGLREPRLPSLRYLTEAAEVRGESALVTSVSPAGACSALVLSVAP